MDPADPLQRWKTLPGPVRAEVLEELRKLAKFMREAGAETARRAASADTINEWEAGAGAAADVREKADALELAAEVLESFPPED